MRSQLPDNALVSLLRQCYLSPKCHAIQRSRSIGQRQHHLRTFQTSASRRDQHLDEASGLPTTSTRSIDLEDGNDGFVLSQQSSISTPGGQKPNAPRDIAILGGGITGLASAFYLTRELPNANITLYESSDRLGGWLRSEEVDVGNGSVVFEQGPRSLRPATPAGMVTLELVKKLGLEDELIITSQDSVAALNRYIYYPDRLVRMPGRGWSVFDALWATFTEPVFKGLLMGAAMEYRRPKRQPHVTDESVGDWLIRRLGTSRVGDNLVSAVIHGIYAGDIYQLSMKTLQPRAWYLDGQYGSVTAGTLATLRAQALLMTHRDLKLFEEMNSKPNEMVRWGETSVASIYTFKKGVGALVEALELSLRGNSKVTIKMNQEIDKLLLDDKSSRVKITTSANQQPAQFDKVISTISGRGLSNLTEKDSALLSLQHTFAVTVMVVNLFYTDPSLLTEHGFGYLIPQSIPLEQNPERALGVIFDSDASIGQDTATGTKITVMLGGHWWDNYLPWDCPSEEEGVAMAMAILKRHLKIEQKPVMVRAGLKEDCIPQYTVGHDERMKNAHRELITEFKGKVAVAGNSYTGVGLNDCVRAARDVVRDICAYQGPAGITGLEQFTMEPSWVFAEPRRKG